ncbi:MAG: hypothetical protein ACKPJJ_06330, partial [Planctomycetaceae bacterium]
DSLEFPEQTNGPWRLRGSAGVFLWDDSSQKLQQEQNSSTASLQLFLPPVPSGNAAEDTEIVLTNQLTFPVVMYWVSTDRQERRYQTVAPGQSCKQHTFVGHVWMLKREDDTPLGCATAAAGSNTWNLTEQSLAEVSRREPRRGRRNRPPE